MSRFAWIKPTLAGAILIGSVYGGYMYIYEWPRAALQQKLESQLADNVSYEEELKGRKHVVQELKDIASTTLAGKADLATARFRSALGAIAVGCGINESAVMVNTSKPVDAVNPAGTSKLQTRLKADLKRQVDFAVLQGTLDASGTLEQVLRVTAAVQAQPWVHRVETFSIKPEGKGRDRFSLKLGVATMLMPPELAPKDMGDPKVSIPEEADKQQWAAVVEKNMFKVPAPVVAAAEPPPLLQPVARGPAPPPPPPYDEWKLTGVIESRLGTEAFMVNIKSGERMTLPAGATVAQAKFLSGEGERAVFEIGGEQFEVLNGQTLEQRRPASR